RGHGNTIFLPEAFPERYIKCGVLRQVAPGILRGLYPIREPRAVIHIRRCERLPGQGCVKAQVQGVSLIMVNWRVSWRRFEPCGRGSGTNQAAREGPLRLRDLI